MDPNIDTSITEHELFERLGSKQDDDLDHHAINNVFQLNEYVDDSEHNHQEPHHDPQPDDLFHPKLTHRQPLPSLHLYGTSNTTTSNTTNANIATAGSATNNNNNHINGTSPALDPSGSPSVHSLTAVAVAGIAASSSDPNTAQNPGAGTSATPTRFTQYSPTAKPSRLGRPRKHHQNLGDPLDSSSQNLNQAVVSKFRFDDKPVEGPGSRGGKLVRAVPKGKITTMKKRQSTLPFATSKQQTHEAHPPTVSVEEEAVPEIGGTGDDNDSSERPSDGPDTPTIIETQDGPDVEILPETEKQGAESPATMDPKKPTKAKSPKVKTPKAPKTPKDPADKPPPKKRGPKPGFKRAAATDKATKPAAVKTETTNGTKKRTKSTEPTQLQKKYKSSKLVSTSRTTVLNTAHKVSRQLPGPLVGLFYDLYDDNVIGATQNAKAANEKIAFSFPVTKSPYASDIIFIIEFLNKFSDIIDFPSISPQDIESGLSLPEVKAPLSDKYVGKTATENEEKEEEKEYDPKFISPKMRSLFLKLMGLTLNRKRGVVSHSSAIIELKPLSVSLGLPAEWRENIDQASNQEDEAPGSPIDPTHPEIVPAILYEETSKATYNPFTSSEFEQSGLEALEPADRLVMIRILVQWALSTSDIIKSYIFKNSQNADIPGDKETYYASRAILKGFKNALETKIEAEVKLNKREDEVKYYDPTSDPLDHCFRIRIHEGLAGDVGFHIGRFYLCRTASKTNGGIASVKKMTSTWNGAASPADLPSDFKLYVQDVHEMLVQSLAFDGFEFDSKGTQSNAPRVRVDPSSTWYEIASNVSELASFVNALSNRLGISASDTDNTVTMTSTIYKPMIHLYEYLSGLLPLLIRQEAVDEILTNKDERTSRQRDVNYNDRQASYNFDIDEDIKEGDDEDFEEYEDDARDQDEDDDYSE